jgi:hypothetical protein
MTSAVWPVVLNDSLHGKMGTFPQNGDLGKRVSNLY